jgi:hypothetical protein
MKPNELINEGEDDYLSSHIKSIKKYFNKDCVIAYYKSNFGNMGIIKTARTYFCFYSLNNIMRKSVFGAILTRKIGLQQAVNLMGDKVIILNKEEFEKVKRQIILEKLK